MALTKLFLKAKHWHLFSIMFGIPFLLQIILFIILFTKIAASAIPDINEILYFLRIFFVVVILFNSVSLGWFWSIATGLHHKIPAGTKMNLKRFKFLFFTPLIYLLLLSFGIFWLLGTIPNMIAIGREPDIKVIAISMAIFVPIHLFSVFGIFHSFYFAAKTIKTVELQREVNFSDFLAEFFLLWFYPVGVWVLQPRINKIINEDTSSHV